MMMKLLIMIIVVSGCLLVPKYSTSDLEDSVENGNKINVHFNWTLIESNTTSPNVDIKENILEPDPVLKAALQHNGFETRSDEKESYAMNLEYSRKVSDYSAAGDSNWKRIGMKTWEAVSVGTLAIVPFRKVYQQSFILTVKNLETKAEKVYTVNGDCELWYFFFFFPLSEVRLNSTTVSSYNRFLIERLVNEVRTDIAKNNL